MKNKIKKGLVYISLAILLLSNVPNTVHANSNVITYNENEMETYAEQVEWYYRMVNGREQMRLWSRTYGRWITDWRWV